MLRGGKKNKSASHDRSHTCRTDHRCFTDEAAEFSFMPNLSGQSLTNPSSVSELILKSNSSFCRLDLAPTYINLLPLLHFLSH